MSGIVNFQSAKTTGVGGEQQRGYDGVQRKLEIASATCCSLTRKVWYSKPRFTAPRSPTKMPAAAACCWNLRAVACSVSRTCRK